MGNSNGAMHKYTELAYEEELYQGGFIWDFIDQGLVMRDRFGKETLTYPAASIVSGISNTTFLPFIPAIIAAISLSMASLLFSATL